MEGRSECHLHACVNEREGITTKSNIIRLQQGRPPGIHLPVSPLPGSLEPCLVNTYKIHPSRACVGATRNIRVCPRAILWNIVSLQRFCLEPDILSLSSNGLSCLETVPETASAGHSAVYSTAG